MNAARSDDYLESYYTASAPPAPLPPLLRRTHSADVCVVGGGIAGCSAALTLAERGYRVVLLEGQRIGWGASGRSGGQADLRHRGRAGRARAAGRRRQMHAASGIVTLDGP